FSRPTCSTLFPYTTLFRSGRRPLVVQEVIGLQRRGNCLKWNRRLAEVETIGEIVGGSVRVAKRRQVKGLLNELQYASEVMSNVRSVGRLGVRRDDDHGHAEPVLVGVEKRRRDVIVPASPIVPGKYDRGV